MESSVIIKIKDTLKAVIDWDINLTPITVEEHQIPPFYKGMYDCYLGEISFLEKHDKSEYLILIPKVSESAIELDKRKKYFEGIFKKKVAFYFDKISYPQKLRLIKRKIDFIILDKAVFFPALALGMELTIQTSVVDEDYSHGISKNGTLIILGYLNGYIQNGDNGKQIAEAIRMSPTSVSTALKQLESSGICDLFQEANSRVVHFPERKELWEQVSSRLEVPTNISCNVKFSPEEFNSPVEAGLTALANETLLSAYGATPVYAVDSEEYYKLRNNQNSRTGLESLIKLQKWNWEPDLFSEQGKLDPFSLALSLWGGKYGNDERVLKAIDDMLEAEFTEKGS